MNTGLKRKSRGEEELRWGPATEKLVKASRDGDLGSVQSLLRDHLFHNINIEYQDCYGWTPLCWATGNGLLEMARLLLEKGANIEHRDWQGQTPLCLASKNGHLEVTKLLLEKGANTEHQDENGATPLWLVTNPSYVLLYPYHFPFVQKCKLEVARLLLEKGANIEHQDKKGETPLILASTYGQLEVARLLLEKGANTEHEDKDGWTPLCYASKCNLELVRLILDHGARIDICQRDNHGNHNFGRTPVHYLLLQVADPNLETNYPLFNPKIVYLLVQAAVEQGCVGLYQPILTEMSKRK